MRYRRRDIQSSMASSSVSMEQLTLTVRWSGKEYTLPVCSNDTIGELKRRICEVTNVLPKRQKLRYPKVGSKLSDDSLLLSKLHLKSSVKMTMIGTVEDDIIVNPINAPENIDDFEHGEDEAVDIKGKEVKKQKSRCRSDQVKVPTRSSIRARHNWGHPGGEMQSQSVAVEQPSCVHQSDPAPTRASGPQSTQDNPDSNATVDGMDSGFAPSTTRRRGRGRPARPKNASMPPGQKVQISVPARTSICSGRNQVHPSGEMQSQSVAVEQSSCVQQSDPASAGASGPQLTQDNPDSNAAMDGMDLDFAPSTTRRRGRGRPATGLKIASMPPGQKVQESVNQTTVEVHRRGEMQSQSVAVEQPSSVQQSDPTPARASSPQLTQDNPDSIATMDGMDSDFTPSTTKRRGRGRAKGLKIASLPPGQKLQVSLDEYGQPCSDETSQLMTWIGTIARNTLLLPCNYTDWRKIPKQYKEAAWNKLKEKFNINDEFKTWAIRKINDRWRDFKCHLKENVYARYSTYEDRVQNRDERVPMEQWLDLLRMWDSESFKAMCQRNKTNRSKLHISHTAGKRSFAQIRERKRKEHPDGVPPSRLELYIATHTRMDGSPVDSASGEKMKQMLSLLNKKPEETREDKTVHEEIFTQVMGDDTNGWEHLAAAGVCLRDFKTSRKYAAYYWENAELRSEVEALSEQISSMRSQFNTLMQLMVGNQQVGMQNKEVSNQADRSSHM